VIVPQHPHSNKLPANVVKEMVRESVKIAATQPASIKVEIPWILDGLLNTDLEFCEKIISKLR
jgi:hypothetical protein